MEEVLLGSMSNTVSISSSGCRVGDKRGSHRIEVSVLGPSLPTSRGAWTLRLGLLLPWIFWLSSLQPSWQREEDCDAREPLLECSILKDHSGGK